MGVFGQSLCHDPIQNYEIGAFLEKISNRFVVLRENEVDHAHCLFGAFYCFLPLISSLKVQKRLASSILRCGSKKIWLDPNEANEIANANTRKW